MNYGGDAAEQVVHMSLEGMEVTVRIVGVGAKNLAVALVAALREEQKTKDKTSMTKLLKSWKPLTVFSLPEKDLKKFTKEAKTYGVLFNVIPSKTEKDGQMMIDIIARSEDAPKINRVVERFKLAIIKSEVLTPKHLLYKPVNLLEEVLADKKNRKMKLHRKDKIKKWYFKNST